MAGGICKTCPIRSFRYIDLGILLSLASAWMLVPNFLATESSESPAANVYVAGRSSGAAAAGALVSAGAATGAAGAGAAGAGAAGAALEEEASAGAAVWACERKAGAKTNEKASAQRMAEDEDRVVIRGKVGDLLRF